MAAPTITTEAPATEAAPTPAVPAKPEERPLRFADPFDLFEELREEMGRLWGQRPLVSRPWFRTMPSFPEGQWAPRTDIYEKNGSLVIKAELPGVQREDIKVEMHAGDLVITGERKAESEVKEKDYYRIERAYGSFRRRIPLPYEVKPEQIQATYTDGVLEIQIPKPAQTTPEPQKITVS